MTGSAAERDRLLRAVHAASPARRVGRVVEAHGTMIRVSGIEARIGELCALQEPHGAHRLLAEVVGISDSHSLLTPLGSLEGVSPAMEVTEAGGRATVGAGPALLGRVIGAHGEPIDDGAPLRGVVPVPIYREAPPALGRTPVQRPLASGVTAIDAALSLGEGQRMGIFAAAGGGKSTLLGMLARGSAADLNVVVLVGERGREVREFIDDCLGGDGLARSVVVVATSDRPALERARAALVGTAIAEYFRDQGKRVMLLMDSVTRYARALRDLGLALGEPPARRGYPPSVFSRLPELFERAGNNDRGSITSVYTVLLEDEESGDPVGEEVRSILDGHIALSRDLAASGHFPAIDILASTSRVMPRVVGSGHVSAAARMRELLAKYRDIELLLQVGEYKQGADALADRAVRSIDPIRELLRQSPEALSGFDETVARMRELVA